MIVAAGSTDVTTYFVLRTAADGTATTGATITSIDLQYCRSGAAPSAKVDATALAATDSAHADNKAIEIDATDQPGLYRVDWPDAAFAAGVPEVILSVKLASSFTEHLRVELSPPVNPVELDGDATALDNVVSVFKGTGHTDDVDLTARSLSVTNDAGVAVAISGTTNGMTVDGSAGSGIHATSSGGNGSGLELDGNGTGAGLNAASGASGSAAGIKVTSASGDGITVSGADAVSIGGSTSGLLIAASGGPGVKIDGTTAGIDCDASAGPGFHIGGTTFGIEATASAGPAFSCVASAGDNSGIVATKSGAGYDIDADIHGTLDTVTTCTTNSDMRGTNSAALASVCTEARLGELDGANLPGDIDSIAAGVTLNTLIISPAGGTTDGDGAVNGTTVLDSTRSEATGHWNSLSLEITSGTYLGQTRTIETYTSGVGFTLANAFGGQILSGVTYRIIAAIVYQPNIDVTKNYAPIIEPDTSSTMGITVITNSGQATSANLTAGVITINRIRAGTPTTIVDDVACSKAAGNIYYTYTFPSASWAAGDLYQVVMTGQSVAVNGITYPISLILMEGRISREAVIEADTNELQTDDIPTLIAGLNDLSAAEVETACDASLVSYDAVVPADLPSNFGDLAITASTGRVTVGTNADKTDYALSTAGLAAFFTSDSGSDYSNSVAGSVVKETADNATGTGSATLANQTAIIAAVAAQKTIIDKWQALVTEGTVVDASPTTTSFATSLSATVATKYVGRCCVFREGSADEEAQYISSHNTGDNVTFTFASGFSVAPANGEAFTLVGRSAS